MTVRIAHAIPGRLRLRLTDGERTGERLAALSSRLDGLRARSGIRDIELKPTARTIVIRYAPDVLDRAGVLALAERAGLVLRPDDAIDDESERLSERTEEVAALLGIPTSFDRRLVESLALSGASLFAAGRVGQALGGGMTLPAYFAIWLALRRLTGLGRRR